MKLGHRCKCIAYVCMYICFKTSFYVVRHLDSIASYLPTGLNLGFFRSCPSLYLPSSFSSVFLVLSFVSASTSMIFWVIFLLPFFEHGSYHVSWFLYSLGIKRRLIGWPRSVIHVTLISVVNISTSEVWGWLLYLPELPIVKKWFIHFSIWLSSGSFSNFEITGKWVQCLDHYVWTHVSGCLLVCGSTDLHVVMAKAASFSQG